MAVGLASLSGVFDATPERAAPRRKSTISISKITLLTISNRLLHPHHIHLQDKIDTGSEDQLAGRREG